MRVHDLENNHVDTIAIPAQAAGDATAVIACWYAPFKCIVQSVKFLVGTALIGANTESENIAVVDNDGSTTLGTVAYITNTNAAVSVPVTLYSTAKSMAEGTCLYIKRTKVGSSGLALPVSAMIVTYFGD